MNNFPFFSIIVPSYNQSSFIETCLQSILSQSFKNYEIIIQDNLSNDNTKLILKKYSDNKNIFINYEKDFGQADAINRGLKRAKGKWVTWQNCDDFYNCNNVLKVFYEEIISSQHNYGAFYGNMRIKYLNQRDKDFDLRFYGVNFFTLLFEQDVVSNQSCFWKLELHKKYGYLRNYRNSFDYEWFLRLSKNCKLKKIKLKKTVSTFLIYQGQKSSNYNKYDINLRKKILELYRGKFFSNKIILYLLLKFSLFYRFINLVKCGDLIYFLKVKRLAFFKRIFLFARD